MKINLKGGKEAKSLRMQSKRRNYMLHAKSVEEGALTCPTMGVYKEQWRFPGGWCLHKQWSTCQRELTNIWMHAKNFVLQNQMVV